MERKKLKRIAVCSAGINVEYNDSFLQAVRSVAEEKGCQVLYFTSFSSFYEYKKHDVGEGNIFRLINYNMIDGLILLSETFKNEGVREEIIQEALSHEVPVVSIDGYNEGCYSINFRYSTAMEEIVTHLIEEHHFTRINFIAGMRDNEFSEERLDAYRRTLTKYNIPIEKERIGYGDFWFGPAREAARQFLDSDLPLPEAIVCANDSMALAVIEFLTEKRILVPEEIMVTGMDGIREALVHVPAMITAKHDFYGAIEKAFEMLENHCNGVPQEKEAWLDSKVLYDDLEEEKGKSLSQSRWKYGELTRTLYDRIDDFEYFVRKQITFSEELIDNNSFQEIFDHLREYPRLPNFFGSDTFWLCIIDDYMNEKEVMEEIIEDAKKQRLGYSETMNVMLNRKQDIWLGIMDFKLETLLPNIDLILEDDPYIMFFPLHILDKTIGYTAISYKPERLNMYHTYQFFMNLATAMENTKIRQQQMTLINNLEVKYVHDPMTGLLNRRGFYQQVEPVYKKCLEAGQQMMFVSVDLNGLKPINDTYGHQDGDFAITTVGKALVGASEGKWACARFGGDEFVAAGKIASEKDMFDFCQRIRDYLLAFNQLSDKPYEVSASIGAVCKVPGRESSMDQFINEADERMYEDKEKHHSRRR